MCTNPTHSWINKNRLFTIMENMDYLVVQDMYHTTETAQSADLLLPAAGCGEKEGTFINSERRIGVIRKVMDPPGSALPDFEIFKRIARVWGCADRFSQWTLYTKREKGNTPPYNIARDKFIDMQKRNLLLRLWLPQPNKSKRGGFL